MTKKRLCRECKEALGVDEDICRSCGARNPLVLPWYTWPIGALIVLALFALLVDFNDVIRLFQN
jgi:RNA polymerase subunit RPABC4/transcription elongation factor Spt4